MATSHILIYLYTIFVDRIQKNKKIINNKKKIEREISGLSIASFVLEILELIKEMFT